MLLMLIKLYDVNKVKKAPPGTRAGICAQSWRFVQVSQPVAVPQAVRTIFGHSFTVTVLQWSFKLELSLTFRFSRLKESPSPELFFEEDRESTEHAPERYIDLGVKHPSAFHTFILKYNDMTETVSHGSKQLTQTSYCHGWEALVYKQHSHFQEQTGVSWEPSQAPREKKGSQFLYRYFKYFSLNKNKFYFQLPWPLIFCVVGQTSRLGDSHLVDCSSDQLCDFKVMWLKLHLNIVRAI